MIRELILFRPFFSLLLLLSFSPFCTYEPTSQIHPKLIGANDSAIVKELAAGIDKAGVYTNGAGMSALPEEGKTYKDSNTSESYKFTFKYTAGVAVVGTTADNGQTTYYAVVSLTRTPTRVAVD